MHHSLASFPPSFRELEPTPWDNDAISRSTWDIGEGISCMADGMLWTSLTRLTKRTPVSQQLDCNGARSTMAADPTETPWNSYLEEHHINGFSDASYRWNLMDLFCPSLGYLFIIQFPSWSWISGSFVLEDLILDEEVVVSDLDYESCEGLQVIAWMVWTWPDIDRPGSFIMIWSLLICLRLVFRHQPGQQSQDGLLIMPPKIIKNAGGFRKFDAVLGKPHDCMEDWKISRLVNGYNLPGDTMAELESEVLKRQDLKRRGQDMPFLNGSHSPWLRREYHHHKCFGDCSGIGLRFVGLIFFCSFVADFLGVAEQAASPR